MELCQSGLQLHERWQAQQQRALFLFIHAIGRRLEDTGVRHARKETQLKHQNQHQQQ